MTRIERPAPGEHAPYYGTYVSLVPDGDVLDTLERQLGATLALLASVTPEQERFRYAPDKWTVRDVVGHMADTERLFSYRALSFARGDAGPLPGMDQDDWVRTGTADAVPLALLAEELAALRGATIALFSRMDEAALGRTGVASGVSFTVRSFPWIIAGHELHHRRILADRYGLGGAGGA